MYPTPVCICIDTSRIFETANEWVPVFSAMSAIGVIVALALTALVAIGNVFAASYNFTRQELGKRKSKDEEKKPKRKNEEILLEAADDGEVWEMEFDFYADEEAS